VIEAIEEPNQINRCLISPEECNKKFSSRCPIHVALFSVQQVLAEEFGRYDFGTLSREVKKRE